VTGKNHNENTDDWLTPDELASLIWVSLPEDKLAVNRDYLKIVFRKLNIGGVWMWPETQRVFRRVSEHHFMEVK
jgi:hypothetical protein